MQKGIFDQAKTTDLLSTVQRYTGQKGKGGRSVAFFCPKHRERTPSLLVNVETQTWRCFGGCAVGGDVIDFVEFMEFNTVSKGSMARNADGSLDKLGNRYRALEILVGNVESEYVPKAVAVKEYSFGERKRVDEDAVQWMHSNRIPTIDYFVGKRKLTEATVDTRILGTALAYPHWYKWQDKNKEDSKFECIRYSIPWMRNNRAYMVNYRRDDADCMKRLSIMDDEFLYDVRVDIAQGTDYSAGDITDEQIIRHLFGDKYLRNKGSAGFTIFNLDRILVEKWIPYCTVNEAEISAISCEESLLYSVAASYKYGIDFAKAFSRVHQPIIFADNDGGTGLKKASALAEAIGNPRTLIKVVPSPFKDLNELCAYDKINGTNELYKLKKDIGLS